MKVILFLLMFFAVSGLLIVSNNGLAFYKHENRAKFSELYLAWGNNIFSNLQSLAQDFSELNWFPNRSG